MDRLSVLEKRDSEKTQEIAELKESQRYLQSQVESLKREIWEVRSSNKVPSNPEMEKVIGPLENEKDIMKMKVLMEEMRTHITTVQDRCNLISNSVTIMNVGPKSDLVTERFVDLDDCQHVHVDDGGMVDKPTASLNAPVRGRYMWIVQFRQDGNGEIVMNTKESGSSSLGYVGRTRKHIDVSCHCWVFKMNKGDRVWLAARRLSGEARVGWCRITCWLLRPE